MAQAKREPAHRPYVQYPDGRREYVVTYPVGELHTRLYCKYCYTTHTDWYLMPKDQYGDNAVVLCGKCEYTSLLELNQELTEEVWTQVQARVTALRAR
jgi:hypothetical protein